MRTLQAALLLPLFGFLLPFVSAANPSQLGDGQIQAPPQSGKEYIVEPRNAALNAAYNAAYNESQIGDGQIQAPQTKRSHNVLPRVAAPQESSGELVYPTQESKIVLPRVAADPSQINDGQIQAPPQTKRNDGEGPQITQPPKAPALYRRQASAVSFEVDNVDSIVTTTDGLSEPMPSGSHIRLISNSDGSMDLLLGPDLQAQVQSTAESSCGSDQGEGCQAAIQNTLQQADFPVQARGVLIGALGLGGIAAVGVETAGIGLLLLSFGYIISHIYAGDQSVPVRINLPPDDVAQVTGGLDATNVVVSTAGGQPTTLNGPSITVSAPVSTSTNDASDLIVEFLDDETLQWLITESQNENDCSAQARVKRQAPNCNVYHGQNAMNNLGGMPLANLLLLPYIPAPSLQELQAAAQAIFDTGRNIAALAPLPDDAIWNVANFLALIFSEPNGQDPTNTMTVPASEIATQDPTTASTPTTTSTSSTSTTSGIPCPTDANTPACVDDDCQGDDEGDKKCTAENDLKDCPCLSIKDPDYHNDGDLDWLQAAAAAIDQALLNAGDEPTEPGDCSMRILAWLSPPTGEQQGDIGLGVTLYNENGDEVPYGTFSGGINFGESGGTGGLGPEVTWTIGDYVANDFVEIYFGYDGQEFRLSSCPDSDTANAEGALQRTCEFACAG